MGYRGYQAEARRINELMLEQKYPGAVPVMGENEAAGHQKVIAFIEWLIAKKDLKQD
jgi:hypothetical protein